MKSNFEGPLRPGRGDMLKPPHLRPPTEPHFPIRVPRSPITNPRDILPEIIPDTDSLGVKLVRKMLKKAETKGYRRGKKVGYFKGHAEGYALGIEDEKKNH